MKASSDINTLNHYNSHKVKANQTGEVNLNINSGFQFLIRCKLAIKVNMKREMKNSPTTDQMKQNFFLTFIIFFFQANVLNDSKINSRMDKSLKF